MIGELTSPSPIPEHPDGDVSVEEAKTSSSKLLIATCENVRYLADILGELLTLDSDVAIYEDNVGHKSATAIFRIWLHELAFYRKEKRALQLANSNLVVRAAWRHPNYDVFDAGCWKGVIKRLRRAAQLTNLVQLASGFL